MGQIPLTYLEYYIAQAAENYHRSPSPAVSSRVLNQPGQEDEMMDEVAYEDERLEDHSYASLETNLRNLNNYIASLLNWIHKNSPTQGREIQSQRKFLTPSCFVSKMLWRMEKAVLKQQCTQAGTS